MMVIELLIYLCIWYVHVYVYDMVKDTSTYRANRIIFDSDSDDNDGEAVTDMINTVQNGQPDKQVTLLFIRV